ncbi:outer membrane protein [Cereibacter johrii]|uniref:outer membrane protein n=1 Tax=Cereibacter johrii TaxID=445629 RepID=UPI000DCF0F33|nr:porin [Cereibacter johrii]RAZ83502.1 porin family protein [Cereibacter johrii]
MFDKMMISAVAIGISTSMALAGGPISPILDAEPAAPVASAAPAWTGGYIGGNVNFGKGKLNAAGDLADALSEIEDAFGVSLDRTLAKPDGVSAALRAGYDWQLGKGVLGLGAEYNIGTYKSGFEGDLGDFVESVGADAEVRLKNTATIFARAGYLFNDNLLAYGLVGYTRAKGEVSASAGGFSDSYSETLKGTTFGVGAEYKVNANWSAYAEYAYTDFGDISGTEGNLEAELSQIKLGANYRF